MISLKRLFRNFSVLRENHREWLKKYLQIKEGVLGPPEVTKVMEEEWDFLLVLDACRYDMFEEINWIDGKLKKINSAGSSTTWWIKNNFQDEYPNTVVITANPHLSKIGLKEKIGRNPFCHIEDVWDYGWDEELKTVPPGVVNEAVSKTIKRFPDKRFIIHYMQPHFPFIGENQIVHSGFENLRKRSLGSDLIKKEEKNPWDDLAEGKVSLDEFMKAYNSNLKLVLRHVEEILPYLEGKIVITSDHGNCIGEYGLHQHPGEFNIKPLREVPWLEMKKE